MMDVSSPPEYASTIVRGMGAPQYAKLCRTPAYLVDLLPPVNAHKRGESQRTFASSRSRSVSDNRASIERQTIRIVFSPAKVPIISGQPCASTASAIG